MTTAGCGVTVMVPSAVPQAGQTVGTVTGRSWPGSSGTENVSEPPERWSQSWSLTSQFYCDAQLPERSRRYCVRQINECAPSSGLEPTAEG